MTENNPQIIKLANMMTAPAPIIKSFDSYIDFTAFLEDVIGPSGLDFIQGYELKRDELGHVRYYGNHYNDHEFVWSERTAFNDFLRRVNKAFEAAQAA
jgi:hypothetical protein